MALAPLDVEIARSFGEEQVQVGSDNGLDEAPRHERPCARATQIGQTGSRRTLHPHPHVRVGSEEIPGGVATMAFGVGSDRQASHETGVANQHVGRAGSVQGDIGGGAHLLAARALANSAANVSGDKCTYAAVVSGEAWPISSRNTNKSMPAVASSVPNVCRSR